MSRIIEIRSYDLGPGMRGEFHRLVDEVTVPMSMRWGVDVVAYGPSLHDDDSYFLIRAYDSLERGQASQDAFYGSAEWREGPREAVLACIVSDTSIVIEADAALVDSLRS